MAVIFNQAFTCTESWYKLPGMWNFECDIYRGVSLFATHRFDYDRLLLAYGIKKGSILVFYWILRNDFWKKWILIQTEGLELVEHIIRLWKAVLESSFSDLTLNPQFKCVTKLVWIGTSAGIMTRRRIWGQKEKLIGSKGVERFVRHR